ncbi:MAG TPA: homoserine O-acetyltransferase, partial [Candidatus Sulfotelmatobacter sp.]|nr:homoserine O-acetyltransferase [Candidatus Sulfotelmatobacter sp.]
MIVETQSVTFDRELKLQSGAALGPITLAYETYGTLNADRSNAILICHALSGDAHVAGQHSVHDKKPGWWDEAVGLGKAFDTDRYFVLCSNVIGGCSGSTGPCSINPATHRPYGLGFPVVTVADMVEAQRWLLDYLEIPSLLSVTGGSMGGMQAMQWAVSYPDRVQSAIVLASTARVSAQSIALNEVPRQAIYADPNWNQGEYYGKEPPNSGLAVARMIGHITYLSETSMREKFGRRLQDRERYGYEFATEFQVESYLKYHGNRFTQRFDA